MITILTPTFNRANELEKLYQSLVNQTSKDFEWLVVDDGSTDRTPELIEGFVDEGLIRIRYLRQHNAGKHSALNVGFSSDNNYDWIFIVDSDDMLASDCVDVVLKEVGGLSSEFVSVRLLQVDKKGRMLGSCFPGGFETYFDLLNSRLLNDNADVFRKKALEGFLFPVFEGEKFMAESPLYLQMGRLGKTRFLNYKGYIAEYLPGGLSDKSILNRHACVRSTLYVYEGKVKEKNLRLLERVRAGINWWRFRLYKGELGSSFAAPIIFIPFGFLLHLKDKLQGRTPPAKKSYA